MSAPINLLVVGDDENACLFLAKMLAGRDWQIDTAWRASRALQLARRKLYDAVVFNYAAAESEHGADVCRQIRQLQPHAREVFLAGDPRIGAVYRAVEAGAERVLPKPVEPTELIKVLDEQLAAAGRQWPQPRAEKQPSAPTAFT